MDIKEFRQKYPEYNDMDDATLTKSLHQKYYSDMPFDEFSKRFGTAEKGFVERAVDAFDSRPTYEMLGSAIGGGGGAILGAGAGGIGAAPGAVIGGGLGAGAGGQIYDLTHPQERPDSLLGQTQKAAKDIAFDMGASMIVPPIVNAAIRGGKAVLKPLVNLTGLKGVGAQNIDDMRLMQDIGGVPDASLIDNRSTQQMGASLRNAPGSANTMVAADRANYQATQNLADSVGQGLGQAETAAEAGRTIKNQAMDKKGQFFEIANTLYDRVDNHLPPDIQVPRLKLFLDDKLAEMTSTPAEARLNAQAIPIFQDILDTIGDAGIVDTAKRNSIKRMTKAAFEKPVAARTDADRALIDMRNIYQEDIKDAVEQFGGDEGKRALQVADDWWKKGVGNKKMGNPGMLDHYTKILGKEEPANAFQYVVQDIAKKRGGAERLKQIKSAMPSAMSDIRAAVFHELGQTPNGFSYQKFVTDFQKIDSEAKKILFGRAGEDFKKLQRVSEMAASLQKRQNFSNTENMRVFNQLFAPITAGMTTGGIVGQSITGMMGGAALGAATVGAGMAKNYGLAKLYTNPDFVKWLVDTGQRVIINPSHMKAQAAKLALISIRMPKDEFEMAIDYLGQLGYDHQVIEDRTGKVKSVKILGGKENDSIHKGPANRPQ